jgi:hypothetical protein
MVDKSQSVVSRLPGSQSTEQNKIKNKSKALRSGNGNRMSCRGNEESRRIDLLPVLCCSRVAFCEGHQ